MSNYKIWQPMKYATAKSKDILKDALNDPRYGIELKLDGASYSWTKDEDGSVHLYGDKISKKTGEIIDKIDNVPHLKRFAEKYFPKCSQILVEITCKYNWTEGKWEPHSNSKFVNSIMLSNPDKAVKRQNETEPCHAYMFDMLYWDGESIYSKDCIDRYNTMKQLYMAWVSENIAEDWLECTTMYIDNKAELIAEWIANGEEGGVLKLLRSEGRLSAAHAVSEIGETARRPMHTSYKIKQCDTIDVIVMGFEFPEKEYKGKDPENAQYKDEDGNPINRLYALGMINAFKIGLLDKKTNEIVCIGTVASGLNDEIRLNAATNPSAYLSRVIECACMSIDKENHSLRHPRFIRFREDKAAEQCLMGDVFN